VDKIQKQITEEKCMGTKKISIGIITKHWWFLVMVFPYLIIVSGIPEVVSRVISYFILGFCMPVGVMIWYVSHLVLEINRNAEKSVLDDKRSGHPPISNTRRKVNLAFCFILSILIGYGFEVPLIKDLGGIVLSGGSTILKNEGTVTNAHSGLFPAMFFYQGIKFNGNFNDEYYLLYVLKIPVCGRKYDFSYLKNTHWIVSMRESLQ
jgi:hypothetical protein